MIPLTGRKSLNTPRHGFSLFELALILAIVAVIAAIAAPRYATSVARYRAEAAATRMAADLSLARSRARATSASQAVVFTIRSSEYSLPGAPDLKNSASEYRVVLSEAPYQARLVSADFGGDTQVVFDGYGVPDSGGSVVLRVGAIQRVVVLDGHSGRATVQ